MTLGEKIVAIRKKNNISQTALANDLNISRTALYRYENDDRVPDMDFWVSFADMFNLSLDELLSTKSDVITLYDEHEQTHITKYRKCDDGGKEMVDRVLDYEYHRSQKLNLKTPPPDTNIIEFPIYNEPASAGLGYYLESDNYTNVQIPIIDIPYGADFGLYIQGDSMEPKYPDGSIVFIKSQPAVEPGEIGLFALDRESLCKKLVLDYEQQVIKLVSLNPKYKPIVVTEDQTLHTYGKVLGYIRV